MTIEEEDLADRTRIAYALIKDMQQSIFQVALDRSCSSDKKLTLRRQIAVLAETVEGL